MHSSPATGGPKFTKEEQQQQQQQQQLPCGHAKGIESAADADADADLDLPDAETVVREALAERSRRAADAQRRIERRAAISCRIRSARRESESLSRAKVPGAQAQAGAGAGAGAEEPGPPASAPGRMQSWISLIEDDDDDDDSKISDVRLHERRESVVAVYVPVTDAEDSSNLVALSQARLASLWDECAAQLGWTKPAADEHRYIPVRASWHVGWRHASQRELASWADADTRVLVKEQRRRLSLNLGVSGDGKQKRAQTVDGVILESKMNNQQQPPAKTIDCVARAHSHDIESPANEKDMDAHRSDVDGGKSVDAEIIDLYKNKVDGATTTRCEQTIVLANNNEQQQCLEHGAAQNNSRKRKRRRSDDGEQYFGGYGQLEERLVPLTRRLEALGLENKELREMLAAQAEDQEKLRKQTSEATAAAVVAVAALQEQREQTRPYKQPMARGILFDFMERHQSLTVAAAAAAAKADEPDTKKKDREAKVRDKRKDKDGSTATTMILVGGQLRPSCYFSAQIPTDRLFTLLEGGLDLFERAENEAARERRAYMFNAYKDVLVSRLGDLDEVRRNAHRQRAWAAFEERKKWVEMHVHEAPPPNMLSQEASACMDAFLGMTLDLTAEDCSRLAAEFRVDEGAVTAYARDRIHAARARLSDIRAAWEEQASAYVRQKHAGNTENSG
ncbi:hypothetical protein FA10DRAFT_286679 [Acaromyces ingoldii]|uniref:Uncharacterized protein n=1 Tax=Acaromyces ingoldii TaxID=215250 RepID=A0A316YN90_9BASI|nr:hypothetical protein FA10DRAFT_286679 [Acaromyces ingoldii]PWN91010.1 hypothetical protein FA10DRAFT_286679 [Acaromyces ingoldii]